MPNEHGRMTNGLPLNEEFFDVIDTEEKAYWLGFLTADGTLKDSSGGGTSKYVCLALKIDDKDHIQKFLNALDAEHGITVKPERIRESGTVTQDCGTAIGSIKLFDSLVNLGVTPRKAHKVKPCSEIPDGLIRHYWRGFIDGDGSITKNYQPRKGANKNLPPLVRYHVELGCNEYMRDGFYEYILNELGYEGKLKIDTRDHRDSPLYEVRYFKIKWVKDICSHLYLNSSVYLDRKYDRAMAAINRKPVPSGLVRCPDTGRMIHKSELNREDRRW